MHILFLILLAIVVENSVVASTGAKKYLREYFRRAATAVQH
ncbi:hypothetical protein AAZX31_15G114800 [Glycine max]